MKNKTNKTNTVVSSLSERMARGRAALALKSALPTGLMARGLVKLVNPAKAPDSAFDFVGPVTAGRPGLRSGVARGWTKAPTLVGRRHRCVCCNKIVPVIQEESSFCSLKCKRTQAVIESLAARGFGQLSR